MKLEWYVEKWDGDRFIVRTPHAMTRHEADIVAKIVQKMAGNEQFIFKVVYRNDAIDGSDTPASR